MAVALGLSAGLVGQSPGVGLLGTGGVLPTFSQNFATYADGRMPDFPDGSKWFYGNGYSRIISGQASTLAGGGIGAAAYGNITYRESNYSDGSLTVRTVTGSAQIIIFRLSNYKNNWMLYRAGNNAQLFKVQNGGFSQVGATATGGWADNAVIKIAYALNNIIVYSNGVQIIPPIPGQVVTDSFNSTATRVGFGGYGSSANNLITGISFQKDPAATFRAAINNPLANPLYYFIGNSLVSSFNASDASTSMPGKVIDAIGTGISFINAGAPGITTAQILAAINTSYIPLLDSAYPSIRVFVWESTNSLANSVSVAQTTADMQAVLAALQATGKVSRLSWGTCLPRNGLMGAITEAQFETARSTHNSDMRTYCNANGIFIADFDTVAIGAPGACDSLTNYNADKVHLNNTGYAQAAGVVAAVI